MKVKDNTIEEIRIAFGSVAITTVRKEELEHNAMKKRPMDDKQLNPV